MGNGDIYTNEQMEPAQTGRLRLPTLRPEGERGEVEKDCVLQTSPQDQRLPLVAGPIRVASLDGLGVGSGWMQCWASKAYLIYLDLQEVTRDG